MAEGFLYSRINETFLNENLANLLKVYDQVKSNLKKSI